MSRSAKPRLSIDRNSACHLTAFLLAPGLDACCMPSAQLLADLRSAAPLVEPSLLACDFANVEREIRRAEAAGARSLHLDVMDGNFVPNISIGIPVIRAVRRVTDLVLDVHLMITQPGRYLRQFREAGADLITFHVEAVDDPRPLLDEIRSLGAGAGISLNPPTPVADIEKWVDVCDLILVMSVMPGFGGQSFEPVALTKLKRIRELAGSPLLLSVDGGVNDQTIGACSAAGTDLFVTGSALFSHKDFDGYYAQLTDLARSERNPRV